MPRYARRKLNGEYYHIVVQGLKKEFIFNSNEITIISEKELENIFGVSKGKAFKDIVGLLHDRYEKYEFLDVDKNENFKIIKFQKGVPFGRGSTKKRRPLWSGG